MNKLDWHEITQQMHTLALRDTLEPNALIFVIQKAIMTKFFQNVDFSKIDANNLISSFVIFINLTLLE